MPEYYFKEFEDYARDLCIKNKQVLHDDQTNRAFIRFQSEEDIESIPNNAGNVLVIVDNFTGHATGTADDSLLQQNISLLFLVKCSLDSNRYNAIQACQAKAIGILFDFYAKMKNDMVEDDCGPLRGLVPEQMTFAPVDGPLLEDHFGWQLTLPFNVNAPSYDPNKWND